MKPTTPQAMRELAATLEEKAKRLSEQADRRADNAPGSFITGRSGRSRAMDKRTDAALEFTIDAAKKCNKWRAEAAALRREADDIESGAKEKREAARKVARETEAQNEKARRQAIPLEKRVGRFSYPGGIVFADIGREVSGDYPRLAFKPTGKPVQIDPKCPKKFIPIITALAEKEN